MRRAILILTSLIAAPWAAYLLWTSFVPSGLVVSNLENGRVIVLGHAGMGIRSWHTINTLSSFEKAKRTGAGGTEMDVQLTADGHLVAFHDPHTKGLKCPMLIGQHTLEELRSCVPDLLTVREAIGIGWPGGSVISLDVKLHKGDLGYLQRFADALATIPPQYPDLRILIESPDTAFLRLLIDRDVTQGLYLYTSVPEDAQLVAVPMGLEGLSIRNEYISKEQMKSAQQAGIRVMLWGVGTRHHNRQALLKGPDLIQSDRLPHMVRLAEMAAQSR
jgi:glycerophosphoryl diester phosphodiesterase